MVRQFPHKPWLLILEVERWRECVIVVIPEGRMSFDFKQELERQ